MLQLEGISNCPMDLQASTVAMFNDSSKRSFNRTSIMQELMIGMENLQEKSKFEGKS
jgi:hypothetical protein